MKKEVIIIIIILSLVTLGALLLCITASVSPKTFVNDSQNEEIDSTSCVEKKAITFRGIPIEGSEDEILEAFKNKGLGVKSISVEKTDALNFYHFTHRHDDEVEIMAAAAIVPSLKFYKCTPSDDDKAKSIVLAFYNSKLWLIRVNLRTISDQLELDAIDISDLASKFEWEYSIDMFNWSQDSKYYDDYRGENSDTEVNIARIGSQVIVLYINSDVNYEMASDARKKHANEVKRTFDEAL